MKSGTLTAVAMGITSVLHYLASITYVSGYKAGFIFGDTFLPFTTFHKL
jgi:hypothetical protein